MKTVKNVVEALVKDISHQDSQVSPCRFEKDHDVCGISIFVEKSILENQQNNNSPISLFSHYALSDDIKEYIKTRIKSQNKGFEKRDLVFKNIFDYDLEGLVGLSKIATIKFDVDDTFVQKENYRDFVVSAKAKTDDPLMLLPLTEKTVDGVFQLHIIDGKAHIDFRFDLSSYLMGWTVLAAKEDFDFKKVTDIATAKKVSSSFIIGNESKYFYSMSKGSRVLCVPKFPHSKRWKDVDNSKISGDKKQNIMVICEKIKVDFGMQLPLYHEYFISGKNIKGALRFRQIESDGRGDTKKGESIWVGFFSVEDVTPTVLSPGVVKENVLPENGWSALPDSVKNDVPEALRFWDKKTTSEISKTREELFKSGIAKELNIFNGEFRITHKKHFLGPDEESLKVFGGNKFYLFSSGIEKKDNSHYLVLETYNAGVFCWKSAYPINKKFFPCNMQRISSEKDIYEIIKSGRIEDEGFFFYNNIEKGCFDLSFSGINLIGDFFLYKAEHSTSWVMEEKSFPSSELDEKGYYLFDKERFFSESDKHVKPFSIFPLATEEDAFYSKEDFLSFAKATKEDVFVHGKSLDVASIQFQENDSFFYFDYDKELSERGSAKKLFSGTCNNEIWENVCKAIDLEIMSLGKSIGDFVLLSNVLLTNKNEQISFDEFLKMPNIDDVSFRMEIFDVLSCKKNYSFSCSEKLLILSNIEREVKNSTYLCVAEMLKLEGKKQINNLLKKYNKVSLLQKSGDKNDTVFSKKMSNVKIISKKFKKEKFEYELGLKINNEDCFCFENIVFIDNQPYVSIGKTLSFYDLGHYDVVRIFHENVKYNNSPRHDSIFCDKIKIVEKSAQGLMADDVVSFLSEYKKQDVVAKYFSSLSFEPLRKEIKDTDGKEERYVLGVVLAPEEIDGQNELYSAKEIKKAAHKYMVLYRGLGAYHTQGNRSRMQLLESFLAPVDMVINEKKVEKGTWLIAIRVLDDTLWREIKTGKITGFSIFGLAKKDIESYAA